jgi:hypothetical protein
MRMATHASALQLQKSFPKEGELLDWNAVSEIDRLQIAMQCFDFGVFSFLSAQCEKQRIIHII